MDIVSVGQAQKLSSPNPFAVITSKTQSGFTNAAAISWWTYVSNRPPMLSFAMSQKSFTSECLAHNPAFTLNLVGEAVAEAAYACGTLSGRDCDKPKETGLPLIAMRDTHPEAVGGSKLVFICHVVETHPAGDHNLFVAEIDEVFASPEVRLVLALDGYARIGTAEYQ